MTVRKMLSRLDQIGDGGAIAVEVRDENGAVVDELGDSLILLRQNVQVFAYRNLCPHALRRLDWAPGQFLIEEGHLICAAHGAMFALPSGVCVAGPCRGASLLSVPVEVIDDVVYLL